MGAATTHRVEHDAFGPGNGPDRRHALSGRQAVRLADEGIVVVEIGSLQLQVEAEAARSPITLSPQGNRRLPTERPPTHPGEMLLAEFLRPLAISQSSFAVRLGVSFPRLNEIVRGKRGVTPDTALRLERVLGLPDEAWLGSRCATEALLGSASGAGSGQVQVALRSPMASAARPASA